jgi:predicted permease
MPNWIDDLSKDLRQAFRGLIANPLFAAVAIVTLALGIGANTAIFSVINAVVLRSLPVHDPQQVFFLRTEPNQPNGAGNTGDSDSSFSEYVFEQLRQDHRVFADVVAYVPLGFNKIAVRYGRVPEEVAGEMVSGNYFAGLGVQPECGRLLTRSDERDHTTTAVLSYGYWNRSFGHDCSVIGRVISIKGVPFTIAGVAGPRFIGLNGNPTDLWIPFQTRRDFNAWGSEAESYYDTSANWWCLPLAARLRPGITQAQAEAAMQPVFLHAAYEHLGGKPRPGEKPPVLKLTETHGLSGYREAYQKPLTILLVMVAAVLLIACGNISMLLAARNAVRQREFGIRLALGGGRGRLFRQLFVESFVLVTGGAVLGWLFALAATRALARWSEMEAGLSPDGRVLLFTLAISILAGFVFGLAPMIGLARISVSQTLKTSGSTAFRSLSRVRTGNLTAIFQVALCLVLLISTSLLVRTLRNLENVNLGMRMSGLFVFGINPHVQANSDSATVTFYRTLTDRLRALPNVESVTLMGNRIGSGWSNNTGAILDGKDPHPGQHAPMRWNNVGSDYLKTLGVPILSGRDITDADGPKSAKVAVVNSTFVKKYLEGRSALGHTVSFNPTTPFTIVGVAADSKYRGVSEEPIPMAYFPYTQVGYVGAMHFELKTRGNPQAIVPQVQKIVSDFGPDLAMLQPMTQQAQFDKTISFERLTARLSIFFGVLAVVLVATGLYGTIAYGVSRRTSELGIRIALGAERPRLLWMVLREGLQLSVIGILIGLPLALASTKVLSSVLYGLNPNDPLSICAAAVGIIVVTAAACFIPARRAASISPIMALRNE